jgi:hypothetical protein
MQLRGILGQRLSVLKLLRSCSISMLSCLLQKILFQGAQVLDHVVTSSKVFLQLFPRKGSLAAHFQVVELQLRSAQIFFLES